MTRTELQAFLRTEWLTLALELNESNVATFMWTDHRGEAWKVMRETISIAGTSTAALDNGPIARRVERAVDAAVAADPLTIQPPEHLVWFRMAQYISEPTSKNDPTTKLEKYLASKTGRDGNNKDKFYKPLWYKAIDSLWRQQSTWADVEKEWTESTTEIKQTVDTLKANYKPRTPTPFQQYERDLKAHHDDTILQYIPDDTIYLLVDAAGRVLCFRWERALQFMFTEELAQKAAEQFEKYVSHDPPKEPGFKRQAMDAHWVRHNPQFDKANAAQYPGASRGVYFFGFGEEQGQGRVKIKHSSGGEIGSTRHLSQNPENARIRDEMIYWGVMPAIAISHILVQMILDPELLEAQQQVMAYFPDKQTFRQPGTPYSLLALLCDVLTTDHRDDDDWEGGLAMMSSFGQFTGGPLCLRQIGRKMGFPAGSITAIRGAEMHHSIGWWQGAHRYSLVHVCGNFTKAYAAQRAAAKGEVLVVQGVEIVPKAAAKAKRSLIVKLKVKVNNEGDVGGPTVGQKRKRDVWEGVGAGRNVRGSSRLNLSAFYR